MNSQSTNSLTVALVSYHSPLVEINRALDSVLNAMERMLATDEAWQFEIFIIDNSSPPELDLDQFSAMQESFASRQCSFRIIKGQGNVGYGAAHNLVLSRPEDSGDHAYHLMMNTDLVLDVESLETGVRYLSANEDVACLCPSAQWENGEKQYLCKEYPSVFDFFIRGFTPKFVRKLFGKRLSRFEMQHLSEEEPTKDIPIISGCFLLGKTQNFFRVAGFNEEYFLYFEDFDLSMRLNEYYRLAYHPGVKVVHSGGHAARKGFSHIKQFIRSGILFFQTYGWRWI